MTIHRDLKIKKTRYDVNLTIERANEFEQLCEAYDMGKSKMFDKIIKEYYDNSPKIPQYLERIENLKNDS